jgi:hypothetical protein
MARTDKSARISAAVAAFKPGEFIDYANVIAKCKVDHTLVLKRIRGLTKT